MRKDSRPTPPPLPREIWQKAYDAAARFRALEPWRQLYDSDFLGIIDPETNRFLIGSVLGNLGEVFALALYREREGLEFCRQVLELREGEELDSEEIGFQQNAVMAEFVKKPELEKPDRSVLQDIQWPMPKGKAPKYVKFRSYRPHLFPWFIDADEARLITLGLERVAAYYQWRADGNLAVEATVQGLPTYTWLRPSETSPGDWKLSIRPMPELRSKADDGNFPALEPVCQRIRNANFRSEGVWQLQVRPMPMAIADPERPFFASVGLVVEAESGFVFGSEVMRPEGSEGQRRAEFLLKTIESAQLRPRAVEVGENEAEGILKAVCDYLKIPLKRRAQLPALEAASRALRTFLQERGTVPGIS